MRDRLIHFYPDDDSGSDGGTGDGSGDDSQDGTDDGAQGANSKTQDGDAGKTSAELSSVRKEAAKYRRERNELQRRVDELEGAQKSETEKLSDQVKAVQDKLSASLDRERSLRVRVLAGKVGIASDAQEDAARLLDWDSVEDPDDDESVEKALKGLVKEKQYLLGNVRGGADGGEGGGRGSQGATDMNDLLREAAGL